jgi:hypothetical protein
MQVLRQLASHCDVRIMALTTAFSTALKSGEKPLGYRDFCDAPNARQALDFGSKLLGNQYHPAVEYEESLADLGFNFIEWVDSMGESAAWQRWAQFGRFGFLPLRFFLRVLRQLQPDVVVTSNSPRSEQAAIEAASMLGIPTLSMVDLFALPGDPFCSRNVHATRITVLSKVTRDNLVSAGIDANRIVITGNPAFDALLAHSAQQSGQAWRIARDWHDRHIVFWAGHLEPTTAPVTLAGNALGSAVQDRLLQWVTQRDHVCLAVRYHPNEWHKFQQPPKHPRLYWSQPEQETLLPVLMASNQVVVQASTVGAQAYVAGKHVVSLSFSPLVQSTGFDCARFGMASGANSLDELIASLEEGLTTKATQIRNLGDQTMAAPAVARNIIELYEERRQS